jgi:Fic family protein
MPESPLYRINPDRNQPWNDLPELPVSEKLYRTVDVLEALAEAKQALGRLQGRSIAIPNQGLLINSISLQEAKESSAIENIFTTDDDLYKAYSENSSEQIDGPAKEVLRYREALWHGYSYLKARSQFDQEYFIRIYRTIKQTNDGIRPHFFQTYIRQGGTGPNAGQPVYVPPRGEGVVERKLENLLAFINDDNKYKIDPLLKMAIAHFQFEVIHPFRDGNGRTGRVFNIHYLVKKGLLDFPILYLSRYIHQFKDNYYSTLSGVSQRGDWASWLLFMMKAVEVTSNLTFQKINDIITTKDAILHELEKNSAIRRPEQLVQRIFTQPYTRVKHLTDEGLYSENTARNYLNKLTEMGMLDKKTIAGHHYYLNSELYRILSY